MPRSAPSACTEPMCATLVHDNKSKCIEHRKQQQRTQSKAYTSRAENKQYVDFYNSTSWRNLSTTHRKRYPLCAHCLEHNITKPADVVDHVIEIRDVFEKRFDITNLQSLCNSCHNTKTARVRKQRTPWAPLSPLVGMPLQIEWCIALLLRCPRGDPK